MSFPRSVLRSPIHSRFHRRQFGGSFSSIVTRLHGPNSSTAHRQNSGSRVMQVRGAKPPIGTAPNPQPVLIEIGLPAHPLGDRSEVGQVYPAPVAMYSRLPRLAVTGAAVNVGDDDRHPSRSEEH